MRLQPDDYQIAAFFGLIVIFEIGERFRPARPVDRWKDLKLDVLSFAFALLVNRLVTHLIRDTVGDVTPVFLQSTAAQLRNLPSALRIVIALFVVDFIIYWIHRSQHRYESM